MSLGKDRTIWDTKLTAGYSVLELLTTAKAAILKTATLAGTLVSKLYFS